VRSRRMQAAPNVWRQRRAKRVRCTPGLGFGRNVVAAGGVAAVEMRGNRPGMLTARVPRCEMEEKPAGPGWATNPSAGTYRLP
jgi:hypothetical protein